MKIFDCFLYNGEDLVLDIRFNVLNEFIEKFIVVESKFTIQGEKKNLKFNINNFLKFKDKIIYLNIEQFPNGLSNWEREYFQRNYIKEGLNSAQDDDYIIISDVDEIPNLNNINTISKYKYSVFEQKLFYYKLNIINKTNPIWYGSKLCKKKYLKSPQWLREQKVKKYSLIKFYKIKWNIIKSGGWHFSYLMTPNEIKQKINSYAHVEYNNDKFNNLDKIKKSINENILLTMDIFEL